MKENFKKIIIVSVITLVVVLLFGGTYAWYVWSTSDDNKAVINASLENATVVFNGGADLVGQNIRPVANKEAGIVKTITVQTENDTLNNVSFNLYLDLIEIADELKSTDFKYELYEETTLVVSGNFLEATTLECTTNDTTHIELVKDKTISTTLSTYTLYIWIDGTVENDTNLTGKDFYFMLHADGQNAVVNR